MSWWWLVVAFALGWFWCRGCVTTSNDDEWEAISRRRNRFAERGRRLAWEQANRKALRRERRP